MTLQKHPKTTFIKEYTLDNGEPYYPMPMEDALAIYRKYEKKAQKLRYTYFIGRLAEYKYYNMDQVVKKALDVFVAIRDVQGCSIVATNIGSIHGEGGHFPRAPEACDRQRRNHRPHHRLRRQVGVPLRQVAEDRDVIG